MDRDFWLTRWREGRIAFHEGRPNALLERHVGRLGDGRVLVPLCGKAEDMAFLASHGHDVLGVELAEEALRAFFAEHGATPTSSRDDRFLRLESGPFTLLGGDVFALTADDVAGVAAFYDRAALVALPAATRARYVAHLRALLPAGARGLVVTFEYDASRIDGPPFSVTEPELRALYDGAEVELLERRAGRGAKFEEAGVAVEEGVYAVTL